MKIVFVRPSMAGKQAKDALKPLVFRILYSLTPEDVETRLYDERIEKLPPAVDCDAVCFSVETFSARRAYILAARYKKANPNVKVIMGGFHPTACPDEAGEYADGVIVGDAEPVWGQVLEDLRNGNLQRQYLSPNSHMLPYTKRGDAIFEGKRYAKVGVVQWKRGCVFRCKFCSIRSFYRSCVLTREVDDVIEEIRNMKEKVLFLADDNLLHDKGKLKEFLTKLKPLRKKWICQISVNVANDDEILGLMAQSGCIAMIIGFESLNVKNLEAIGKEQNVANRDYDKAVGNIYAHGIMIYATFIFGYPYDTLESFDEVYKFAMRHKFLVANFNPLMAMPATDLYEELKAKGKLVDEKWWLSDEYQYGDAMHVPANYTAKQLAENCKRLRYHFYSVGNVVKRMTKAVNARRWPLFLLVNFISAFEIRRKQRMGLRGGEE